MNGLETVAWAASEGAPLYQTAIQPILILCGLGLTVFYFLRLKSALLDRLVVGFCFMAMVVFVFRPQWTDAIAVKLGVEAGRFLLLYFVVVFYLFLILLLFSHQRKMQRDQTAIVQSLAILSARPANHPPDEKRER